MSDCWYNVLDVVGYCMKTDFDELYSDRDDQLFFYLKKMSSKLKFENTSSPYSDWIYLETIPPLVDEETRKVNLSF